MCTEDMEKAEDEIHRLQTEEYQGFPSARDDEDIKKRKAAKRDVVLAPASKPEWRILKPLFHYSCQSAVCNCNWLQRIPYHAAKFFPQFPQSQSHLVQRNAEFVEL